MNLLLKKTAGSYQCKNISDVANAISDAVILEGEKQSLCLKSLMILNQWIEKQNAFFPLLK